MLTMRRHIASSLAILGLLFVSSSVFAETPDSFARIRQTQTITIANREASRPFSFVDDKGQASGYSVELCQRVVERMRKDPKLRNLKVQYVTVSGAERIPKIKSGEADMECGSTTNTKARQEQVGFSYTIFVAGMKILTRKNSGISDVHSLTNATVALSKGTTSEKLFTQLRAQELGSTVLKTYNSNTEALKALQGGAAVAFPQDDVLLSGLLSTLPDRDQYSLTGDYLSIEPYAIMVRKDDNELRSFIDKTLSELYASGEINKIYEKWFNTASLQVPMSRLTREAFSRPASDSGFAKVLGYTL